MKLGGNTVLITGGATGIGLALAKEFVAAGSEVIVCCRNRPDLGLAVAKLPELKVATCDASTEEGRRRLHDWTIKNFPDLNIVVNNAGIQRMVDFKKGTEDLRRHIVEDGQDEIDVNLKAYVYLAALFVPDLMKRKEAAVINVSSGLAFIPLAITPVYSATKAAVHSFSITLRRQLRDTSVKVFEVIPPTTDTNLDKGARRARGQANRGIPAEDVAKAAIEGIAKDEYEIAIGQAVGLRAASKDGFEQAFTRMNG
jgi:uncharacterized oxidoreductase